MSEQQTRRMQVKVLYSFNNNATIFLSRSKNEYPVKTASIPVADDQEITLGAFDLKSCVQQIIKSSPENFKLQQEDYVVYYKDTTEQPDEPFVANGQLSTLVSSSKVHLVPGRVCQNLSASYLFGDKSSGSSLTLEIRLKLHTVELTHSTVSQPQRQPQASVVPQQASRSNSVETRHRISESQSYPQKRPTNDSPMGYPQKRPRPVQSTPQHAAASGSGSSSASSSSVSAVKATRTKSLPIFNNVPSQTMYNIMNHDKLNLASKYDSKSVQDRFKSAPFFQAKIIDKPVKKHRRYAEPQRAMRTRSMVQPTPLMISSPINEESLSDSTDDTEYRENNELVEEDEEEEAEFEDLSPYTPQQPPYNTQEVTTATNTVATRSASTNTATNNSQDNFQSLPDLEDLDSKRTHTIPHNKLPKNHGLICVNSNCATVSSIAWRYFETEFHPHYFAIHRAKEFNKKHYEGMFGPLCNACYLFLRNKGFMRPENVVKKYLQQQRYKRDLKTREELNDPPSTQSNDTEISRERSNSLSAIAMRKAHQFASSPVPLQHSKFPTPSHTPSVINQVIQNSNSNNYSNESYSRRTPNYNDTNEFLNQLNNFGGPLTDIDPLPQDIGVTPPMMATKSNTRVINLYDDGEDKENQPPSEEDVSPRRDEDIHSFETMIRKSFTQGSEKSSPNGQTEWINTLFTEPTPKDQITPKDTKTPIEDVESDKFLHPNMPNMKTFSTKKSASPGGSRLDSKKATVVNMPSSPFLTGHQNSDELDSFLVAGSTTNVDDYAELDDEINELVSNNHFAFNPNTSSPNVATRNDTTMSWNQTNNSKHNQDLGSGSTPNTDLFSNDDSASGINDKMKYNLEELAGSKETTNQSA